MKNLSISDGVQAKLSKSHGVTSREVEQCFANRSGRLLTDTRTKNRTTPPTLWFIAQTNKNRSLKIVFMQKGSTVELKTAYEPNAEELRIYARFGAE